MLTRVSRRSFLNGLTVAGGVSVAGIGTAPVAQTECAPGHTAGDPPCEQVDDDAGVLTGFDTAGTPLAVSFDYPCGWRTNTTDQFQDRSQATVTRDDFDGYANIQVRTYYEPVEPGYIDSTRGTGDYGDLEYEFAGETRTGVVSARETAEFGTVGHAAVPIGRALVHVELTSTLKGIECTQPRPDYDLVRDMLRSLGPNHKSTFPETSGNVAAYGVARIDPQRIAYDAAQQRVEVPARADVTLPGITNLSPRSNLAVQVNSKAGKREGTAFFDRQTGVQPRTVAARDWRLWEITTDAFDGVNAGAEFEIKIRAKGVEGNLHPGAFIAGVVVDQPTVETFAFTDKPSDGTVVVVDRVAMSEGGSVVLEDASGTAIGRTGGLAADQVHEDVAVTLTESLGAGAHDITAVLVEPGGDPYPANNTRTATITVEGGRDRPALFRVSDLQLAPETLAVPGDTLTVVAAIENAGEQQGTANVSVSLAGSVTSTTTVALNPGETQNVTVELDTSRLSFDETATVRVATGDESRSGTVSVDSRTASPTTATPTPTVGDGDGDDGEGGETNGGGPGFGVRGALVSVLAAAGLARWYSGRD